MNKSIYLTPLVMLSVSTAFATPPSIMPEGLENVHLDMPIKELIATRKNIKSGTTFDYCLSDGRMFCKWYKDPNNPKRLDQNWYKHLFKENYSFLFFDTVWFSCSSSDFDVLVIDGGINTRKQRREYPENRDKFILYAIKKWGKPDQLLVGDEKFSGRTPRHDYYAITMNWLRGDITIHAEFPIVVEEYFKSLSTIERLLRADDYPLVKIIIRFRAWGVQEFGAEPFIDNYAGYKPRQIVNREEADKLLKSIGFDKLLKRAMGDTPSTIPEGLENIYLSMPITDLISARKNIKSGNTSDYCVSSGPVFCKWYKHPNNPVGTDQDPNSHLFKENYDFLFFDTVWFGCSANNLYTIGLEGDINTRKKLREFPKNRDKFISYAIKKWGKPDQLLVGDEKSMNWFDYYSITMNWLKGGTIVHAEFPLAMDEYFKSLSVSVIEKPFNTRSNIAADYPQVRIDMLFTGSGADPFSDIYKPRRIVNKEEADKLLKSIGFDELLKRATTK